MSMFFCGAHQREEDSDEVGFVECDGGTAVCQEAQDKAEYDQEFSKMTQAERRYEMGGEFGGDGPDD